jgi:hypothetical protein
MTVAELIEDLKECNPEATVQCSVDCDVGQDDDVTGRRVFGDNCRGPNPYGFGLAGCSCQTADIIFLMFDHEETNF